MTAAGDIPIEGHELGPFVGFEAVGFHAVCSCGTRFDGAHPAELVDLYEQHYAVRCLPAGVGKARAALAESLARKAGAS